MSFLQKPFPALYERRNVWFAAVGFGLFVTIFLYFFRPFGLVSSDDELAWIAPGYGLVTTLCMLLIQHFSPKMFPTFYREETWTVGKEVLQIMANIAIITTGNWIFSAFLGFAEPTAQSFLVYFGFTLAIGVFPVSMHVLWRQNVWQRKYLRQSDELNSLLQNPSENTNAQQPLIQLRDENSRIVLDILPADLIAIESADNYVKVHYLHQQSLRSEMIRSSLTAVEMVVATLPQFFRAHRSWVVNMDLIEKVNGNARGYTLRLRTFNRDVPVARSRIHDFNAILSRD